MHTKCNGYSPPTHRSEIVMFFTRRQKESEERKNAWKAFVESIRSKLTVKQVVDGVRSGGDLTFDYVLLVLTAE